MKERRIKGLVSLLPLLDLTKKEILSSFTKDINDFYFLFSNEEERDENEMKVDLKMEMELFKKMRFSSIGDTIDEEGLKKRLKG